MQKIAVRGGYLDVEVIDLTPPWVVNAPTVILHHGIGIDMNIWSGWLPQLVDSFRIVRFNMRDFGKSAVPSPDAGLEIGTFVDDVIAVANATGTPRFHLLAESFGGMVSLTTAIRHPSRVMSATLLSTPHCGADIRPLGGWPALAQSAEGMRLWNDEMMAGRFTPNGIEEGAAAWFRSVQEGTSPAWLSTMARLITRTDLSDALPALDMPVLLISGDASPYVGVSQVARLKALLPDAQVQILAGARHGIAFSHPAQSASAFREFMASAPFFHPQAYFDTKRHHEK